MVSMAAKVMRHVDYIIVDPNAKYGKDWAETDETTVTVALFQNSISNFT